MSLEAECAFHRIKVVNSGCIVQINVKMDTLYYTAESVRTRQKYTAVSSKAINAILWFIFPLFQ